MGLRGFQSAQRAGSTVKRNWKGLWVAFDADGKAISEGFEDKAAAEAWSLASKQAADRKAKRGPRPCLRCGVEFDSAGFHNRLCSRCRHCEASDDEQRPYINAGRGR